MTQATAHIVDDDEAIRDALSWLLRSRDVSVRAWESGEAFLAGFSQSTGGCIVLDVRMEQVCPAEGMDDERWRERGHDL